MKIEIDMDEGTGFHLALISFIIGLAVLLTTLTIVWRANTHEFIQAGYTQEQVMGSSDFRWQKPCKGE